MNHTVSLELVPRFCNAWPEIKISINGHVRWHNSVTEKIKVNLEFELEENNCIQISYLNKQSGPEVWDTIVDDLGNIIQDQNCVITNIIIDGAKCNWLLSPMTWNHIDGKTELSYGFMSYRGYTEFLFPADVYAWIIKSRNQQWAYSDKKSSIDYKTLQIHDQENDAIAQIIDEVKQLLGQLHV